jgi:hypothetical protein
MAISSVSSKASGFTEVNLRDRTGTGLSEQTNAEVHDVRVPRWLGHFQMKLWLPSPRLRKRLALLVVGACVLALVARALYPRRALPSYNGRSLGTWVAMLENGDDRAKAADAIAHIGTNATPYLLAWIQFEPEPGIFRSKLANPYNWYDAGRLGFRDRILYTFRSRRERVAEEAAQALGILGARAAPAIPELTRLLNRRTTPITALRAGLALVEMGTNGLPPLLAAIDDPEHQNRFVAVLAIETMSGSRRFDAQVVPHLIQCLGDDKNPRVPRLAASVLGRLGMAPDLVVPALTTSLGGTNSRLRWHCAVALGELGPQAAAALPALTNALSDPDPGVRREAQSAIARIAAPSVSP